MACTRIGLLLVFTFLLSACGGAQRKDAKPEQTVESGEANGEQVESPLEVIPNPYLENKPSVPGRSKVEFAKAKQAMEAGNWNQAEGMLTLMTETYPKLAGPYVNLGICYYNLQQIEQAIASLKKAIEINPKNMDAYSWLGFIYRGQGRFEEAESTYKAALVVWPQHAESQRNLGILYELYMGRLAEALEHYKILQRILPEEDRRLNGWIRDLEHRIATQEETNSGPNK